MSSAVHAICVRTPVDGKLSDILFWSDQATLKCDAQLCLYQSSKSDISSRRPPVLTPEAERYTDLRDTPKGKAAKRLNDYSHRYLEFSTRSARRWKTEPPLGATERYGISHGDFGCPTK
jgi:hypothetical protein